MNLLEKLYLWRMLHSATTQKDKRGIVLFFRNHCKMSANFGIQHVDLILPILQRHLLEVFEKMDVDRLKRYVTFLSESWPATSDKLSLIIELLQHLPKCQNSHTPFLEIIADIPGHLLHVTPYKRCHNVDELIDYLLSTPKNRDPTDLVDPLWYYPRDKAFLFNHPGISADNKSKLQQMEKNIPLADLPFDIYLQSIEWIGKLGYIMRNDDPSNQGSEGFDVSERALIFFKSKMDALDETTKNRVLNLQYERQGDTVQMILKSLESTCLHLVGDWLIRVYLLHHRLLLDKIEKEKMKRQRQQQQPHRLCPVFRQMENNPNTIFFYIFATVNINYTNFNKQSPLIPVLYEYEFFQASYIFHREDKTTKDAEYIKVIQSLLEEFQCMPERHQQQHVASTTGRKKPRH
uniref:Uncharacterized protein n=1 Tax=viral metagenome TaxID=1070528 RepID=A0A6C0K148_9ZZZZ